MHCCEKMALRLLRWLTSYLKLLQDKTQSQQSNEWNNYFVIPKYPPDDSGVGEMVGTRWQAPQACPILLCVLGKWSKKLLEKLCSSISIYNTEWYWRYHVLFVLRFSMTWVLSRNFAFSFNFGSDCLLAFAFVERRIQGVSEHNRFFTNLNIISLI